MEPYSLRLMPVLNELHYARGQNSQFINLQLNYGKE
jgi:hypothetical protein